MKNKIFSSLLKYIVLAVILAFLLFPIYWVLITSFKSNMEAYRYPPSFFPVAPTLDAYIKLFEVNNDFLYIIKIISLYQSNGINNYYPGNFFRICPIKIQVQVE